MPKTKEQVLQLLEKNYQAIQLAELSVYDKNEQLDKDFAKSVKELDSNLKKELKNLDAELKTIKTDFGVKVKQTNDEVSKKNSNVEASIAKAKKAYESALAANEEAYQKEVTKLNEDIATLTAEYDALVKDVEATYNKDVETSKKAVESINLKSEKDQATLNSKIEDLKAKHDAKVEDLNEKQADKIMKLKQANLKEVSALEAEIEEEREKLDTKLANLKPVYDEELEEIDENAQEKKEEFEAKKESIRSSADQRISVRKKHLERAQKENDNRSAKQHKKDIDKFRKEAERDLNILTKTYKQDNEQAIVYRQNFIKDNLEKLADLERDFADYFHEKQINLNNVKADHSNNIAKTKLDYEKMQAEELNEFNNAHKEIRDKQEEAIKDTEIDVENEEDKQIKLKIEFDKTNSLNDLKHKEDVESKEKELRDASINKEKEDMLSKDTLDIEIATLNNELELLEYELNRDLKLLSLQERIEEHKIENKRLNANKSEFYNYQSNLDPLFKDRASEMFKYEEQELNNRYALKLAYLGNQLAAVEKDYEVVVAKINQVFEVKKAPFEKVIQSIAGDKQEELEQQEEEYNLKVQELNEKISPLTERKDRRERQQLEDRLESLKQEFAKSKESQEEHILSETKVYQTALEQAKIRHEKALTEAKSLFEDETASINHIIDTLKSSQINELDEAKARLQATEANVQDFVTKSASRNTESTEHNQNYLDAEIAYEQSIINEENSKYEGLKEKTNNNYNNSLKELQNEKEQALSDTQRKLSEQEANLETYKNEAESNKNNTNNEASKLLDNENDKTTSNKQEINKRFEGKKDELKDELNKKESEFKHHIQDISKKVSEEDHKLDVDKKQISKDADLELKETIQKIDSQLKSDKSNI